MSACISRQGEYSEHEFSTEEVEPFICQRCGVFAEDAALSEIARLRGLLADDGQATGESDGLRAAVEALYEARDALYRGEGPDAYADADLIYGEWLGNRADHLAANPPTSGSETDRG